MFTAIKGSSAQRITEVREHLDFFSPFIPAPPIATPRHLNMSKGLIFVELYGTIEFTVIATLAKVVDSINADLVLLQDLKHYVWAMALHTEFDSLIQANKQKWNKRIELFHKVEANPQVSIPTDIMPMNGQNFTEQQLRCIWETFNITEPLFSNQAFRGRLQEIVSYRINIAHGLSSAADVGSRVTPNDLTNRINEVSEFCSYFISVFEDYCFNKKFRK